MKDLIEALRIFQRYSDLDHPIICAHDELVIAGISPRDVSSVDIERLAELSFLICEEEDGYFFSFRFGSA